MHCNRCRALMYETNIESGELSQQIWYECPSCGHVSFVSVSLKNVYSSKTPVIQRETKHKVRLQW